MKKYLFIIILFLNFCCLFSSDKDIFDAMKIEIKRAQEKLRIEKMEVPYFFSLRMIDSEYKSFAYAFGKLEDIYESAPSRELQALVRVNKPELDNSNYFDRENTWNVVYSSLPLEDDTLALRQVFWIAIDDAYKNSLKIFSAKKAYMQKHPQEDYQPDFLPIPEKTEMIIEPDYIKNIEDIKYYAQQLSAFLRDYQFLTKGKVSAVVKNSTQYYTDSEGNTFKRPESVIIIDIYLSAYTKDWYQMNQKIEWVGKKLDDLPRLETAKSNIASVLSYMEKTLDQKPYEEYSGPVVFMGEASAKFFLDLLGKGVSKIREKLGEEDYPSFLGGNKGFLERKFNQKILPSTYQVWDKPNEKVFSNIALIGYLPIDDEGVKSADIQVIKDGKIVAFPTRRTATKKFKEINGHARSVSMNIPDSYITNLFIQDDAALSEDDFFKKIKEVAEDEGLDKILIIAKLRDDKISSYEDYLEMMDLEKEGSMLSKPEIMYLYNVKTGEKEPIWGLEFSKINENVMKEIIASTKAINLVQYYPASYTWGVPMSINCPDILIEHANLVKTKAQMQTPSPLPAPKLNEGK